MNSMTKLKFAVTVCAALGLCSLIAETRTDETISYTAETYLSNVTFDHCTVSSTTHLHMNGGVVVSNGTTAAITGRTRLEGVNVVTGPGTAWRSTNSTQSFIGNSGSNSRLIVDDYAIYESGAKPFSVGQGSVVNTASTNNCLVVRSHASVTMSGAESANLGRANFSGTLAKDVCYGQNRIDIADYGFLTLARGLVVGNKQCAPSNVVSVTDSGMLLMAGQLTLGNGGGYNRLLLDEGGSLTNTVASGNGAVLGAAATSCGNEAKVGTDAVFRMTRPLVVGVLGSDNVFEADGAALIQAGSIQLASDVGSRGNVVELKGVKKVAVADGASVGSAANACCNRLVVSNVQDLVLGTVTVGAGSGSVSNSFACYLHQGNPLPAVQVGSSTANVNTRYNRALVDCGQIGLVDRELGGLGFWGVGKGEGNGIEVRNLTATNALSPGLAPNCTNGVVRISGTSRIYSAGYLDFSSMASGSRVELVGDVKWYHGLQEIGAGTGKTGVGRGDVRFSPNSWHPGQTFVLDDGATFYSLANVTSLAQFGGGNRIFVGNNALMSSYAIRIESSNNEIVLSNGTYRITNECRIPNLISTYPPVTNNLVRFQGIKPLLRGEGNLDGNGLILGNGSGDDPTASGYVGDTFLDFDLPVEGYESAPIHADSFVVIKSRTFVTVDEASLAKLGPEPREYVLAEGLAQDRPLRISNLTELGSKLPERCRLKVVGSQLVLKVKGELGMRLIFR